MIEISRLKRSFGSLEVLDDINLNIQRGSIYGLVGRSGAGKSTLLRCINGLETYDKGSLKVDGVEVKDLSVNDAREFKKNIGMVFQNFSLLNRMTVYENIALPMKWWRYDKKHIDKRIKDLLDMVGISDKIFSKSTELSGGQKQRVAIARAIAMNPKVLLCDEATSALDPKTAQSIISLLNEINRQTGITIVVVTHQMSVLRKLCQEISILEEGKIVESGKVSDIFLRQPQALKNLTGVKEWMLPRKGVNLRILMSQRYTERSIITKMARETDLDFMVLGGEMEQFRDSMMGSLIINIKDEELKKITSFLDANEVLWKRIDEIGTKDTEYKSGGNKDVECGVLGKMVEIL